METSKLAYYTTKYMPFVISFFFIAVPVLGRLYPDRIMFNGQPGPPDVWDTALFASVGILVALMALLFLDKLVIVQMNNQTLRIKKGEDVIQYRWLDVESIKVALFFSPPLYILRLKNYDGYFLFHTSHWAITFMGFTWDLSDMGTLIKKKKRELGV